MKSSRYSLICLNGNEKFLCILGDLFILVFSMDSRESFEEVVRLRENILETKWAALNPGSGFKKKTLPKIPMILAGNKCDREPR